MEVQEAVPPVPSGRITQPIRKVIEEAAKFGIVGLVNAVLDFALFNALTATVLKTHPLTANAISTFVATLSAYAMNRRWSFKHRQQSAVRRELALFIVINVIAFGIGSACLAISHYGFHFESTLANNVAKLIGLGLGTIFRFWAYRTHVWPAVVAIEHVLHDKFVGDDEAATPVD